LGAPAVDPGKCIRLAGSGAILLTKKSPREEVDRVVRVIKDLLTGKWFDEPVQPLNPDQIAVLYRRDHPLLHELREKLTSGTALCSAIWLNEKGANAKRRIGEPGVKILTMHSSKGLQFKAVILIFAGDCPAQFPDSDEEEERRLFYVALTRAEDYLVVSRSRESKFTNEIELVGKDN
jgi:ATP-dependent exoDNAse (exonuclease V) beta subunit